MKIRIPTPLRPMTGGKDEISLVGASTVRESLSKLESSHPGISARILDDKGNVRRFVNLFLNSDDVRFLKGLDTEVKDGDTLSIVPAIAGG